MSARQSRQTGGTGVLTLIDGGSAASDSAATETGRAPRKVVPLSCGGCYAKWTALGAAHCSGCHRTFSGLTLFDRHRSGVGEHGRCTPPGELRDGNGQPVCEFRDGMWRFPEMSDADKAARFGGVR